MKNKTKAELIQELFQLRQQIAKISHDVNNALSPIVAHIDIAIAKLPEDSLIRSNMEEAIEASSRISSLVGKLFDLSCNSE